MKDYFSRLDFDRDICAIFKDISEFFNLGKYKSHEHIAVGYEDVNFCLSTDKGKFFVKIFSKDRKSSDIARYSGIIEHAIDANAKCPSLFTAKDGKHLYNPKDTSLRLLVMEWLEGQSFWDSHTKPTPEERKEIIRIATAINSSDYQPTFSYDSWAVNNLENEFNAFRHTLSNKNKELIADTLQDFLQIDHKSLPHSLIHGDLIATNVMKTSRGIYAVDFSVANYLPRIQELAVLFSSLLFDEQNEDTSKILYTQSLDIYSEQIPLTEQETKALPIYTRAAQAMHVIGASKAVARDEDDDENQYWLRLGEAGLSYDFYNQLP